MEKQDFITDIFLPDMLYGITIRSPIAKGSIVSIDCPKLPENYTLLTAKDIPGNNYLYETNMPVLAENKLSYIGEPVAMIFGPNRNTLEECVKECKVNTKEEKPIFNKSEKKIIAVKRNWKTGDPDGAFSKAESVIQNEYSTGIQEHWYAETVSAVAWFNTQKKRKELIVKTAAQWPKHVKNSVAIMLGTDASKIKVESAQIGMPLDGKLWYPSLIACHTALGAWLTKKPVRLTLTRGEDFLFSPKRCASEINIKSAYDAKGELLGLKITAYVSLGAYQINANEIIENVFLGCLGVYDVKNIDFEGYGILTNIPPQGAFAGFGLAQGNFALERHISQIRKKTNVNPVEWRKKNVLKQKMLPSKLQLKDNIPALNLIDSVVKMSGFERKWAAYSLLSNNYSRESINKGIGIALGYQGNDNIDNSNYSRPGWIAAVVEVEIDPIEFIPNVRGVWLCVEGGKILKKDYAVWRLKASAVQALCWAYNEKISYVSGAIPIGQLNNFDIIAPLKIPPINVEFLESKDDPKGISDLPFTCIPAAFLQAVSQIMGCHFQSIPLKALDILSSDSSEIQRVK